VALASNIVLRGGTYYVRVAVPLDLKARIRRREIWQSLRTKDPREAKRLGAVTLAKLQNDWASLRHKREPGEFELRSAVISFFREEEERDLERRLILPTQVEIDAAEALLRRRLAAPPLAALDTKERQMAALGDLVDFLSVSNSASDDAKRRAVLLKELRAHAGRGETVLVRWAADDIAARAGWELDPAGFTYRRLCQMLMRAWMQSLELSAKRDEGVFDGKPTDTMLNEVNPAPAKTAAGESAAELYEQFAIENPGACKPDTLNQNRKIVDLFLDSVGPGFAAAKIDKKVVREWKGLLLKFPVKASETKHFKGKPIREVVKLNETIRKPTLTHRTVNKYLSALGAFCQWLVQEDWLDTNPVTGFYLTLDRETPKVLPYTNEQLRALFSSPLFTGCESEEVVHKPGNFRVRDHRYWLPLLALFTGARMGELAQLEVADVRQDRGHWILHVTREGGTGKTTKTKGSMRVIPLHPELVKLGFLEVHASARDRGDVRLFPAIVPDTRGQLSGGVSREYGRYLQRIEVKAGKGLNFHSFRHLMADAFRQAGYRDEEFAFLLGHTQATTTGRYGLLPEGDLARRVEMINAVTFPGLDLSPLYPSTG
jgi:integrase